MPSLPVKPEFGPTLPELVRPRVLAVAGTLLAAGALVFLLSGGASSGETHVVIEEPIAFNLRYAEAPLERRDPMPGELLRLEGREQSLTIKNLVLPPYRGAPSGSLPVFAEEVLPELRQRHDGFELADEGRVRINEEPGYSIGFRARDDEGKRIWGRYVLLVPDEDGERRGVAIEIINGRAAGVSNAAEVGAVGQTKLPYRSFRFGTEPP